MVHPSKLGGPSLRSQQSAEWLAVVPRQRCLKSAGGSYLRVAGQCSSAPEQIKRIITTAYCRLWRGHLRRGEVCHISYRKIYQRSEVAGTAETFAYRSLWLTAVRLQRDYCCLHGASQLQTKPIRLYSAGSRADPLSPKYRMWIGSTACHLSPQCWRAEVW